MEYIALNDICDVRDGTHDSPKYVQEGYPLVTSKNIVDGKLDLSTVSYLSQEDYDKINERSNVDKGDIIMPMIGTIGNPLLVGDFSDFAIKNVALIKFPDREINNRYIWYFLKSGAFKKYVEEKNKGGTQKFLSLGDIRSMKVPKIGILEQKAIVGKLDVVYKVISERNQEIELLDNLIKARFVEMFGTYPVNEKGWETGTIRDLVTEVRYGSSRKAADGDSGQYPYLRMNNITYSGELDLSDTKTIDIPAEELPKCTVRRGDVLFNRTNSKELVGKTCVYNRDEMMVLAGFVVRVRVNERILPDVLSAFLNTDFLKQMLYGKCKAAIGQANINAQELQNIGIYIPPIELQKQFVEFKEQVDKSKAAVQKGLDQAQLLFDSLMQKYFG